MEFEQIIKRLDWMEKERAKDKDVITSLKEKIASLESSISVANKQIKGMGIQISEINVGTSRFEQFDMMLTKQRADVNQVIENYEKQSRRRERDAVKRHQAQLEEIYKSVGELRKMFTPGEYDKKFKERAVETQRLVVSIDELKQRVSEAVQATEAVELSVKALDEARKNDLKRIVDIQGDVMAVRKRSEESREKYTLTADSIRNIDSRVNELLASEVERKQTQTVFIEQQTIAKLEYDRAVKDWRESIEAFKRDASGIDSHVQELDEALRGAKKAQETYLELNTKLERRISEITEMQRLTEERLRQEWVSFKADDQKRWTGISLSSEDSFRDIRKDVQKFDQRIKSLDDITQVLQDQIHQITDATEQQLQELMNVTHEWMTSFERIMGHNKKVKK